MSMGTVWLSEWLLGAYKKFTLFIIISESSADVGKVHSHFVSMD
jgi:hypothetical protein